MNSAKDSCLKNRIKSAMEKEEPARSLMTAAAGLVDLGDKPAPVSPEEDEAGNARIFPQRLYDILSDERNTACIAWLPHGRGFIIKNRKRFAAEVLPRYFKQTKYTSFTRKLNRWDFARVTRGPELGAYYHQFFRRGEPTLCTQMYCKNERAKFATKQGSAASAAEPPVTAPEVPPLDIPQAPVQQQELPLPQEAPVEPQPIPEPQKVAMQQQQPAQTLPKIHPSLLLSPRAKMLLASQMAAQAHMQQNFNFARPQHQQQAPQKPAASTNAIVNAAVRALYQSNVQQQQPPSDFSVAAFQQQQAAQMAQAQAAMQVHQQQQSAQTTAGGMAAAMPKLPPSQAAVAQARMAQARRNSRTKGPTYRASAA